MFGTDNSRVVAQGGLKNPLWRRFRSSGIRFDSQSVVHSAPQLLFAAKIAFRRLDRDLELGRSPNDPSPRVFFLYQLIAAALTVGVELSTDAMIE